MGDLSANFSREEFVCPCGCGRGWNPGDIDPSLILHLEAMRTWVSNYFGRPRPLIITSGCRCPQHNIDVGGVDGSVHTLLPLVVSDIKVYPGPYQHTMTAAAFSEGVMGFGIAFGSYIHCDWHDGSVKPRPAEWGY